MKSNKIIASIRLPSELFAFFPRDRWPSVFRFCFAVTGSIESAINGTCITGTIYRCSRLNNRWIRQNVIALNIWNKNAIYRQNSTFRGCHTTADVRRHTRTDTWIDRSSILTTTLGIHTPYGMIHTTVHRLHRCDLIIVASVVFFSIRNLSKNNWIISWSRKIKQNDYLSRDEPNIPGNGVDRVLSPRSNILRR